MDDAARPALFDRIAQTVPATSIWQTDDIANAVTFLVTR
ncbi:hypothetical protein [Rhizobium tubonense]|nr:hypothetical protein [Rhizobium tubonense]